MMYSLHASTPAHSITRMVFGTMISFSTTLHESTRALNTDMHSSTVASNSLTRSYLFLSESSSQSAKACSMSMPLPGCVNTWNTGLLSSVNVPSQPLILHGCSVSYQVSLPQLSHRVL